MKLTSNHYSVFIQKAILLFLGTWFTLVGSADLINILQEVHLISGNVFFNSQNYTLIKQSLQNARFYSEHVNFSLFIFIQLWSWFTASCFWLSFFVKTSSEKYLHLFYIGFISSCAMTLFLCYSTKFLFNTN